MHTHINKNVKTYKQTLKNKSKQTLNNNSKCAPFIQPKNISNSSGLANSNLNIIKSATKQSCFTIDSLRKIAQKWNDINPQNMIEYTNNSSGDELWKQINKTMSSKCKNEICWLKQEFLKDSSLSRELMKNFKPIMPKKWLSNKYEWLNTLDIQDVMNQYEIKYSNFEFIGPVPIDFDTVLGFGQCVANELCKINIASLIKKGKTQLGIIFNLDKHNQSGSHWVAMYVKFADAGINNNQLFYWDSYGLKPANEITKLMEKIKEQCKIININLTIKENDIRHQYKNSECGVYCIYFITSLLQGRKFEHIIKNIINDDDMNSKRIEFFTKEK